MPEREVKIGLQTYMNDKGEKGQIGFQGQTVNVHDDDVERFDELNEQPGGDEPYVPQRVPEDVIGAAEEEEKPAPTKRAAAKK